MASTSLVFDILANDRASSKFAAVGRAADKSTTPMAKMGKVAKTAALGVAAVGVGAIAAGKYVFNYGAKLEQMGMKAETVFGNQLGSVQKWADESAAAMGLTTREATGLAANFGDLLIPMGFARKEAAGMATDVVGLSGALSQWSGGTRSAAEVAEILSAAMLGERDALKGLGISISEAEVDARLLKNGQDKLTGAALQQAEALATQALIMEKSTDAQKAFADGGSPLLSAQAKIKSTLGEVRDELVLKLVPAMAAGAEVVADNLVPAIEGGIEVAKEIGKALAPAAEEIAEALGHLAGEGDSAGDMFHNTFIPAVRTTAEVVGTLVDFVDDLPGPVKSLGVEVGIAALVFPSFAAGVTASSAALTGLVTKVKDTETRTAALSGALRNVAGVGGMVLLAKGAQESSDSLGLLETTAGGALMGFSVGGPWGAAIGAGAGALLGLATQTDDTAGSMQDAKPKVQSMIDSLDQLTGATIGATRASALQNLELLDGEGKYQSAIGYAKSLGISTRTLVDASLGHAGAIKTINKAIREQGRGTFDLVDANGDVIGSYTGLNASAKYLRRSLGLVNEQLRDDKHAAREAARASQELAGKLKGIPRNVRTKVIADGVPVRVKELAALSKRYHLLPKQINTLIEAAELPFTVKQVKNFQGEIDKTDKKKATPKFDADGKSFDARATHVRQTLADLDKRKATPKADLSLDGFWNQRATLMTNLNNIPDETVYVNIVERGDDGHPGPGRVAPRLTTPRSTSTGPGLTMTTPRAMSASPMSGGGGVTVNINGPVFGDPQAYAREVQKQLLALKRNTGANLGLS